MLEYCVTGGTGFIASELVRALLAEGHAVRATVRDPADEAKVGFLRSFDGAKERLRLVKADLVVEGSFDEAVDGADGVFHTACPVYAPPGQNIQEALIDPAIRGTANVLKSCSKASSVRRVVLTSTCAAVSNLEIEQHRRFDLDFEPNGRCGTFLTPQPRSTLGTLLSIIKG
ncbi:putative Tetraketide alpha-pyrone reductase 2 [Cocos nucifera]|uniref:Putative Tetraketide alpha-pyrone reductase 2 n=1 Tax=Cocos nucifera TaxID=13894 RepID=A0A8K0HYQ9_COCNU|nr:putative Tetraketide alpha-pyrone reductase 2 [Cocos nucifera]